MADENDDVGRRLFASWLRATVLGWWVGFVLILGGALLADLVLGDDGQAQFMVGAGMGAGVGYMQGRVVKHWLGTAWSWAAASTIGIGGPFIVYDASSASQVALPFSLPLYMVAGSAVAGALQWRLLRARFDGAAWWLPASITSWGLVAGVLSLDDLVRGPMRVVLLLLAIVAGGAIVGTITGATLVSAVKRSARAFP